MVGNDDHPANYSELLGNCDYYSPLLANDHCQTTLADNDDKTLLANDYHSTVLADNHQS